MRDGEGVCYKPDMGGGDEGRGGVCYKPDMGGGGEGRGGGLLQT